MIGAIMGILIVVLLIFGVPAAYKQIKRARQIAKLIEKKLEKDTD